MMIRRAGKKLIGMSLIMALFSSVFFGLAFFVLKPKDYTSQHIQEQLQATKENRTKKEEEQVNGVVGDVVPVNDVTVRVMNKYYSNGNEKYQPKEGKKFLVVDVQLKNNGNESVPYNPMNFSFIPSNKEGIPTAVTMYHKDDLLGIGTLLPYQVRNGTIVFEIPKNEESGTIKFKNGIHATSVAMIKL